VLFVDDDETLREAAVLLLENMGFRALTAKDGEEALAVVAESSTPVVCILLDLSMPRLDGEACLRELRRRGDNMPVVLCSGHPEEVMARRFAGIDIAAFLQKPYGYHALSAKLTEVLGAP
jgi:FixJ family two-component response regulator